MNDVCIILAGGLGTRLRGVVSNVPKCLAPIDGRPFLEWQLHSLLDRGVKYFVLALGYGSSIIQNSILQPWAKRFEIKCVVESKPLGTGGAVYNAMQKLGLKEVLVANGDTYIGGDLSKFFSPLNIIDGEYMLISTTIVEDCTRFGFVNVDEEFRVIGFSEKANAYAGHINAGVYRINLKAFNDFSEMDSFSLEKMLMPHLSSKFHLYSHELSGPFIDIGVPKDYYYLNENISKYFK